MGSFINAVLSRTVSPVLRSVLHDRAVLLMFHGFTDRAHTGGENSQHKHLDVDKLETFLTFLTRHYRIVHLDEVTECLSKGLPPPPRSVVLTFDDGFLSNYTLAFPVLQRLKVPAIIYLATQFVDEHRPIWTDRVDHVCHQTGMGLAELRSLKHRLKQMPQEEVEQAVTELEDAHNCRLERTDAPSVEPIRRSLNWDQVREMQASGLVRFGAHTHTHKILGRCRPETIREELQRSKALIERETGRPCDHFCYPNGTPGDFSTESESLVAEAGFKSSITTVSGWVHGQKSPFLLPRFGVTNQLDVAALNLVLTGVFSWMEGMRKRARYGD
ncbi:MAG: polysaccharide deacetylase family protein [Prosthecobacter sp.]